MGLEAVCIASGPSLTESDVELVRNWREGSENRVVIVTNTTFRIAPWADWLYAMDRKWWEIHMAEVRKTFKGRLISNCSKAKILKVEHPSDLIRNFDPCGTSGTAALSFAIRLGAVRVVMLGYDNGKLNGQVHWHADHPKPLGNAGTLPAWNDRFKRLRTRYPKANVLNASRHTLLKMFPRVTLEEALV